MKRGLGLAFAAGVLLMGAAAGAAEFDAWDVRTFGDEAEMKERLKGNLEALAKMPLGEKLKATSKCPRCGKTNSGLYLAGDEVTCGECGEKYKQDDTSYFGPAARDANGVITAFKGDPLKYELGVATARLLLNPEDKEARAYVGSPGLLKQHYHFAAVGWARLYPMLADKLGEEWKRKFAESVAVYREEGRPSDQGKGMEKPSKHDYVGTLGELLGGDVVDGGTENHKTQWRTSGLLWAEVLPKGPLGTEAKVSGEKAADAAEDIFTMLRGYLRGSMSVGNGEWQSSTYYPYNIRGYLNLYDFSPEAGTRDLARAQLDLYFAVYGLHMVNGTYAGAQKRGFVDGGKDDLLRDTPDQMAYYFLGLGKPAKLPEGMMTSVHMSTTGYRPNRVLSNVMAKEVALPFEAKLTHPDYHMKKANVAQEYLWMDKGFGMGSVYLLQLDNAGQQTVWSLVVKGSDGNFVFGGGQPRWRSAEGHSAYSQTAQYKNTLVVTTCADQKGQERLKNVEVPRNGDAAGLADYWEKAAGANQTWIYVPKGGFVTEDAAGRVRVTLDEATVSVVSLTGRWKWIPELDGETVTDAALGKRVAGLKKLQEKWKILVALPAEGPEANMNGAVVTVTRVGEKNVHPRTVGLQGLSQTATVTTTGDDEIVLEHQVDGLRGRVSVNGEAVDFEKWAGGAVVDSPYVQVKDGGMVVSDGKKGYGVKVDMEGARFEGR